MLRILFERERSGCLILFNFFIVQIIIFSDINRVSFSSSVKSSAIKFMFHTAPLNEHPTQTRDSQLKQLSTCTSLTDSHQAALEASTAYGQSLLLGTSAAADKAQHNTDDVASKNCNRTSVGGTNVAALLQQLIN